MDLNIYIKQLCSILDLKSLKERGLILIASLMGLYFFWQILIFDNIAIPVATPKSNINPANDLKSNAVDEKKKNDSNKVSEDLASQKQIKELEETNNNLQNKLNDLTTNLISLDKMNQLLKDILNNSNIQILSFSNAPVVEIAGANQDSNKVNQDSNKLNGKSVEKLKLYKHTMEIILLGDFFQLIDFITAIEKLPNKLFWEELQFTTDEYPAGKIKLVLSILSKDPTLFSVSSGQEQNLIK